MAAVSQSVIDSVKSLGLNGSTAHTNGALNGDIKIKHICCVGAGYVGRLIYPRPCQVSFCLGELSKLTGTACMGLY